MLSIWASKAQRTEKAKMSPNRINYCKLIAIFDFSSLGPKIMINQCGLMTSTQIY